MSSLPDLPIGSTASEIELADDTGLLVRLAVGDRRAFEVLYDRHARAVHAYSRTHLRHRQEAEETTQDVFLTLWERRGSLSIAGTSLLPWLLVTGKYKIANRRRAALVHERRRSDTDVHATVPSPAPGPEEIAENTEVRSVLDRAVSALTERDQAVFEHCIVDGLTYDEAAALLGVTTGVIRNQLSRLRSRLRDELHTLRGTP